MEKNIKFLKKNWLSLFITLLLLINLIWAIASYKSIKNRKFVDIQRESQFNRSYTEQKSFVYDLVSPDFKTKTFDGEKITLSDFSGNVIILRFSRFYLEDLPHLLYLEHLAKRFQSVGVTLLFINTLGKHEAEAINKIVSFSTPIIEDDGTISSLFKTSPHELIIIGRDFRLKFKHIHPENRTIYNQVIKFAFQDSKPPPSLNLNNDELANLVKNIIFRNVKNNNIENLGEFIESEGAVVALFVSVCIGCPETKKIWLMKEISGRTNLKEILLFGRGNSFEIIKEFSERTGLSMYPITVGVIENEGVLTKDEYFQIYQFNLDPRILIFDAQGRTTYVEKIADERLMDMDFLLKRIQ
jgi:hypothetical protein